MSKRTLLIDGDIIAYKTASVIEEAINWGDVEDVGIDLWTLHSDPEVGIAQMENELAFYMKELEATDLIVALTDKDNFRREISSDYKSNRKGIRKPLALPSMRKHFLENYNCYIRPGLEADDVIGILMTHKTLVKGQKISVSVDKDFKTIPGVHYNINTEETIQVEEAEANYWHFYQTLTGDTTDGYRGCPGVGPKGAEKILEPYSQAEMDEVETWGEIVKAFEKKDLTEEDAITQARLAYILRANNYNFKKKAPILWNPPS